MHYNTIYVSISLQIYILHLDDDLNSTFLFPHDQAFSCDWPPRYCMYIDLDIMPEYVYRSVSMTNIDFADVVIGERMIVQLCKAKNGVKKMLMLYF